MEEDEEICRVCRSSGSPDKPLFHPCICTGSIRHVHQECLTEWLQHSKKEYCELCNYKFSFKPIYSPDMPTRLPVKDLFFGLLKSIGSAVKCWIHYTLVAIAWLGVVPLTASRIYNCVFAGSVSALASLPMDMLSTNGIGQDIMHGCAIVACTLSAFIALIWLRVQVLNGELPSWLVHRNEEQQNVEVNNNFDMAADDQAVHEVQEEDGEENQHPQDDIVIENDNEDADINWNINEPERDAEDPSWERILGLDGSFLFIEHVFWVIALNTLFILVFAFCPYHLGHFFLFFVDLHSYVIATKFEGVLTALCGYVLVTCAFLSCHVLLKVGKCYWSGRIFGLCYIILKVGLLVLVEIGIFPLLCGIWLDICTLKVFDCTLLDRRLSYLQSPGITIFLHWVIGMIFVFYFANFLMLAKEVLRPTALWFLRNLNDPDFNPINEMIHLSIYKYCRRFLLSTTIFGSTIVIIAWVPVNLLVTFVPNFLPYNAAMKTSLVGEFCLQILILQFTVPGVLEHGTTKASLKSAICNWASFFGGILGVRSYLLNDDSENTNQEELPENNEAQADNSNTDEPSADQPYEKPPYFGFRILLLLTCVAATFAIISFAFLVIPIFVGRAFMRMLFKFENVLALITNDTQFEVHETYTFLIGLYFCWNCLRLYWALTTWIPRGRRSIMESVKDCVQFCCKFLMLVALILGFLPLLIGILIDLLILIPATVPLHQTPIIILWQDWAVGVIVQMSIIAGVVVAPATWLRENIERAYQQGIRRLNFYDFMIDTYFPVVKFLLLCLILPYLVGYSIPCLFECDSATVSFLKWRTHPILNFLVTLLFVFWYEVTQLNRLYDHIKNERYLIGRRLQDYNP